MAKFNSASLVHYLKTTTSFDSVLQKVKFITYGGGKCVAEMLVEEEHTNPMGGLHGGFSATLVDCISSYALVTHDKAPLKHVSVNMNLSYLSGAKIGDEIVIDASTVKAGKTLAFLEVEIRNKANNQVLVQGSHTKYLLS